MEHYVHHTPGRLRVKIPSIRKNPDENNAISHFLLNIKGVERVTVNPITGSVLIHYDIDTVFHWQILHLLNGKGYFGTKSAGTERRMPKPKKMAEQMIRKAVVNWTLGWALENSGLSFLTVLI